jgi:hypothetical protein
VEIRQRGVRWKLNRENGNFDATIFKVHAGLVDIFE